MIALTNIEMAFREAFSWNRWRGDMLALVAGLVLAASTSAAWKADCWLYCESKDPPKALVEMLGEIGVVAVDDLGIPVRIINALGAKLAGGGYAGTGSETFNISGAHLVRDGVFVITASNTGGGGGGGGGSDSKTGGGGCGGGFSRGTIAVGPSQSVTVTRGAGGSGGGGSGTGTTGGTTTVGLVVATGGQGGQGAGGAVGAGCATPGAGSGGDLLNYTGGAGNSGLTWPNAGSAATAAGNGTTGGGVGGLGDGGNGGGPFAGGDTATGGRSVITW